MSVETVSDSGCVACAARENYTTPSAVTDAACSTLVAASVFGLETVREALCAEHLKRFEESLHALESVLNAGKS